MADRAQDEGSFWIASRRLARRGPGRALELRPGALLIEGASIAAVREGPLAGDGRAIIDVGESPITPSFVNAHTHLAMNAFRAFGVGEAAAENVVEDLFYRVEAALEPADVRAFARVAAYESIASGVGAVWDHYYHAGEVARAAAEVGLCAVVAPTLQDEGGPGRGAWERGLAETEALDSEAWRARGIWVAVGPHATDTVSDALWERSVELARERSLPIHAHLAQSIEEVERSWARHGCSPIERLERLGVFDPQGAPSLALAHALFASRADLARLDAERHALGFCPLAQAIFDFPAPVRRWQEAGASWFVATDAPGCNDALNPQRELGWIAAQRTLPASYSLEADALWNSGALEDARRLAARRRLAWDEARDWGDPGFMLDRVWAIPGRMHPQVRMGALVEGALANLLVWDHLHPSFWPGTDPLRAIALGDPRGAIRGMLSRGRWVTALDDFPGELMRDPARREAEHEASRRLVALRARVGF